MNEFDRAAPPDLLLDIREEHGGIVQRISNGSSLAWVFRCPGSISPKSRFLLKSIGFRFHPGLREWRRWDSVVPAPPTETDEDGSPLEDDD